MQLKELMKNNQYRWAALGGLALILVIIILSRSKGTDVNQTASTDIPATSTATSPAETATTPSVAKPTLIKKPSIPTGQTASEAYLQALSTYQKSGYYMQFFPCQASPGSLILKKGSKIMLDNRDSKAHIIGIRSVRYNIGSYNFAIATLDSVGTNYVTCDGGGSAQITVVP